MVLMSRQNSLRPARNHIKLVSSLSFCTAQGPHIELRMIPIPEEPIKVTIARIDPTRTKNATLVKIEKASWRKRTC
jgi:hypothetical protein